MDAAFIQQNQIIERYLMGRLPLKGAQDFERFCRENPEIVTQLGMPDRINAALRLLDASGQPEPWAEKAPPKWQRPEVLIGVAAFAAVSMIAAILLAFSVHQKSDALEAQKRELQQQPLLPAQSTRTITVKPLAQWSLRQCLQHRRRAHGACGPEARCVLVAIPDLPRHH